MSSIILVEEWEHNLAHSYSPARSDLEDGLDSHYINPFHCDELKKIINFEVKYSFQRNYRVIVPSPTDAIDNPPPRCIGVYLEALEYDLQFPLPKIVMEILQMYDITVVQLICNAWVSIQLFIATCKLKRLECKVLAFLYMHIIQYNNETHGENTWYRIISRPVLCLL